jgi:hypothetical protein
MTTETRYPAPPSAPAQSSRPRPTALTFAHWVVGGLALCLVALLTLRAIPAYDLYWQLKTGEIILQTHHVPSTDLFSYTAFGDPWYVQEWLSEVLFAGVWKTVGREGLIYLRMLVLTAAFGLVLWRSLRRSGRPLVSVGLTLLAAWGSAYFFDNRPQMLTYLMTAGMLLILDEYRAGRWTKPLWFIPALLLVWVNLHAGFFLGLVLLWAYTLSDVAEWAANREIPAERLLVQVIVALAASVVTVLNPNGWHAFTYPFLLQGHESMRNTIGEWFSPDFHRAELKPFGVLLLVGVGSLAFSVRRRGLGDVLVVLGLIAMSLDANRHGPLLAIVGAPIFAEHLGAAGRAVETWIADRWKAATGVTLTPREVFGPPWRWAAVVGTAGILLFLVAARASELPRGSWFDRYTEAEEFPKAALDWMEGQRIEGNVLNAYEWGGYCAWRWYPQRRVFIDGRAEVYFQHGWDDYYAIAMLQPGWGDRLNANRVNWMLLSASTASLGNAALSTGDWVVAYQDQTAVVLRRKKLV